MPVSTLIQPYSLRMSGIFEQPYGDADLVAASLVQWYGDAAVPVSTLVQPYDDAQGLQAVLEQPYSLAARLVALLAQPYSIAGDTIISLLAQPYSIRDVDVLLQLLGQPYSLLPESSQLLSSASSVRINGVAVEYYHISLERSLDQYCITAEVHLAGQRQYMRSRIMDDIEIEIDGVVYDLFIESRERNRGFATAEYVVRALSKTAWLDFPYDDGVVMPDNGLTGLKSEIAAAMADGFVLRWQTVDEYVPSGLLIEDDSSRLDIIRQLAESVGAVLQTASDGALVVMPGYRVPVNMWEVVPADHHLTDAMDFYTTGEDSDVRDGSNRYLVTDGSSLSDSLRLEEEKISSIEKIIRCYPVPWRPDFDLRHTGAQWVSAVSLGVDVREIENEIVEFIGGSGKTSYPVYALRGYSWQHADLGTITAAEDGTLTAAVAAESLLEISYSVRSHNYRIIDQVDEKLQLVADREDS